MTKTQKTIIKPLRNTLARTRANPCKNDRFFLLGLGILAFSIRLIYTYQSQSSPFFEAPIVDAQTFIETGKEIAKGDFFAGSDPFWQPPLYPYFLAFFCWLFPTSHFVAIRLAQSLLGTFSCLLVYRIGRRSANRTVGRISGLLAAVYATFIYFDGELLAVSLEIFLNLLLLDSILDALRRPTPRHWIKAGLIGGLASITRPNILLFLAFFLAWLFWRQWQRPRPLARMPHWLLLGLPILLVILPVTWRNYALGDDLVFISSNGGINFYIGNNAHYDSTVAIHPGMHWENLTMEPVRQGLTSHSARSTFFFAKAFDFVSSQPLQYGELLIKKLDLFWSGAEIKRNQDIYYARQHAPILYVLLWGRPVALPFGVIGALSLLGLALSWRQKSRSFCLLRLYTLTYVLSVLLFFVTARYRAPVVPILLIFAAWALVDLCRRLQKSGRASLLYLAPCLVLLLILFNRRPPAPFQEDAQLYHDLGEVHLRQEIYDKAETYSLRALQLEAPYPSARHNLAVAYQHQQRHDEVIKQAQKALAAYPQQAKTRLVLAQTYLATGKDQQAVFQLQRALALDSDLTAAHYHYGRLLRQQKRYAQALPHLIEAALAEPDFYWAKYELGLVYKGKGDLDKAADYFAQAQRLDPSRSEALNALGAVHFARGNYPEAQSYFERALEQNKTDPNTLLNLGLLALQTGHFTQAEVYFHRALQHTKAPMPIYRGLLQIYLTTGQEKKAKEVLAKLQKLAPKP